MKKMLFLLISLLTAQPTLKSVLPDNLPTEDEVLASRHVLTVALFASIVNYEHSPVVPEVSNLDKYLKKHPLLKSPWIHQKGFAAIVKNACETNASEEQLASQISNHKIYPQLLEITQRLLTFNLTRTYTDYCEATKSK